MIGQFPRCWIKRLMDIIVSVVGLVVLSPVLLVIALRVRRNLGAPVLFRQIRPGLQGHPFTLIKFRTMRNTIDVDGNPRPDDERLSEFGQRLRAASVDELPELWNVLRGDMSLVGPRPLLMEYLDSYTPEQARRHAVRPGITGWAQVNGRNAIGWEQKFSLDVWYVDHWSLWLDTRILVRTVIKVMRREGISGGGTETMTRFDQPF
jgi:lipopolysaccharide/colanic/teichoic acid biosynthesis glycosyltransferase